MIQKEMVRKQSLDSLIMAVETRCYGKEIAEPSTEFICRYVALHAEDISIQSLWNEFTQEFPEDCVPQK